jgi:hypothetical protein
MPLTAFFKQIGGAPGASRSTGSSGGRGASATTSCSRYRRRAGLDVPLRHGLDGEKRPLGGRAFQITRGRVDEDWALQHHRKWAEQQRAAAGRANEPEI